MLINKFHEKRTQSVRASERMGQKKREKNGISGIPFIPLNSFTTSSKYYIGYNCVKLRFHSLHSLVFSRCWCCSVAIVACLHTARSNTPSFLLLLLFFRSFNGAQFCAPHCVYAHSFAMAQFSIHGKFHRASVNVFRRTLQIQQFQMCAQEMLVDLKDSSFVFT